MHVFIEAGLLYVSGLSKRPNTLRIFEMGFGTGLNAFLTAIKAEELSLNIHYTSVETSPFRLEEASLLNYSLQGGYKELFEKIHSSNWNKAETIL